jgi:gamma-glutamyl hercynylcysteine S-oxide synthase
MATSIFAPLATSSLRERLEAARACSDELFRLVRPEAIYDRPIPERHRIIFYMGHLEAFDWNLLAARVLHRPAFDPALDRLFAFGIDPVDGKLPADTPADWPEVAMVRRYVAHVRAEIDPMVEAPSAPGHGVDAETLWNVAIEHRLMHAETLAYMLHQLPVVKKVQGPAPLLPRRPSPRPAMIEIPAGAATLGLARDAMTFGWDNEFDAHLVEVSAFAIDRTKVSMAEYLAFVEAGGYADSALWRPEDWAWIQRHEIRHPAFWQRSGGTWLVRTMFGEVPLPGSWPVHVSHAEATAYARWAGKRLPTEAEWHRAAYGTRGEAERPFPWGDEAPTPEHTHADFYAWDPIPVDARPAGASAFGVLGMVGNGWEWTSTPFAPFTGFTPFPFYPGYSADFFDGRHFVMKGASTRTAACLLRRSFRNWYQAHYGYVYAGFRCVQD